jgi:ABC-type thiamin/hydroxymethylpyrimidine transport system permease subunit
MGNVLFFSKKEIAVIVAVGVATGLVNHQTESLVFGAVAGLHDLVLFNDYLAYVTGGPVFGDFLQTYLEYGAVLAVCLVRKPAAGTIALTINGLCQVFVYGTHDPHLLYGFSGLGADIVFALFRYRRYDVPVVCLAGISAGMFWYPIVWFTHGIYLYPLSFILSDLVGRILGSAVGDGLLGAGLAAMVLNLGGRRWDEPRASTFGDVGYAMKHASAIGLGLVGLGVLVIVMTYTFSSVSNFFLSIGPRILSNPHSTEYNPGYVIGVLLIFLVLTALAFWNLRSRYSE